MVACTTSIPSIENLCSVRRNIALDILRVRFTCALSLSFKLLVLGIRGQLWRSECGADKIPRAASNDP